MEIAATQRLAQFEEGGRRIYGGLLASDPPRKSMCRQQHERPAEGSPFLSCLTNRAVIVVLRGARHDRRRMLSFRSKQGGPSAQRRSRPVAGRSRQDGGRTLFRGPARDASRARRDPKPLLSTRVQTVSATVRITLLPA